MRTRDNDPVISLHLSESFLILGDVNGELHRIEVLFETTCYSLNKLVKRCGACVFPILGR